MRSRMFLLRMLCAVWTSLSGSVYAVTLDVLWYTYAQPTSEYVSFYSALSGSGPGSVSAYPQSEGFLEHPGIRQYRGFGLWRRQLSEHRDYRFVPTLSEPLLYFCSSG